MTDDDRSVPGPESDRLTPATRAALERRLDAARASELPAGFAMRPARVQIGTIVGAVIVGPIAGFAITRWVAPGSELASFIGFIALPMVLGAGFAVWRAIIASVLFRGVYRGLLRGLYMLIVRREQPQAEDVLPDARRLAGLFHEVVRAAAAFARVGITIGILSGILLAIVAPGSRMLAFVLMFGACTLYGRGLTHLAREGYLPMPEE